MTRPSIWSPTILAALFLVFSQPGVKGANDQTLKLVIQTGHTSSVTSVALSGDGRRVLTGSVDQTAILWDAATGQKLQTYQGHTEWVLSVALSGDGRRAWTASGDGTTRLWEAETGKELAALISIDAGQDWLVVTPDGFFDGSPNGTKLVSYRTPGTMTLAPLEQYRKYYYKPGLLAAVWSGKFVARVPPVKELPPVVRFLSPTKSGQELTEGRLEVKAVAEPGGNQRVKEFRLLVDGRPHQGSRGIIKLDDHQSGPAEAAWTVELPLGSHTLKVLADTEYSQGVSEEIEVRFAGVGRVQVELPRLYILAIGVAKYQDEKLKLDYADSDAKTVAEAFQQYSRPLFRSIDVKLVTNAQATAEGVKQGLTWLRKQMTQQDVGVFYFSGHGQKDAAGRYYLLPVQADVEDLLTTGVSEDDIKRTYENIPGRLLVILDACHAGAIGGDKRKAVLSDDLLRDLATDDYGVVVMAASMGREFSLESNEHRRSYFTVALTEALQGKAAKTEGAVYLHHLDGYLKDRVKELTKGQQHPVTKWPTSIRSFPLSKP